MEISDNQTGAGMTAAVAAKGMAAGGATGIVGWLTSDAMVGLIGLAVAVLGLIVTVVFRYIDTRIKQRETARLIEKTDAEEARAQELHRLRVAMLQGQLQTGGGGDAQPPPDWPPNFPPDDPGAPEGKAP
jgi:beta-lactamase regulating signal transducer with metallopeptidase domain